MNCLEARRRIATEPGVRDEALAAHLAACAPCAAEAARGARLDRVLRDAAAVPVPEGLASRVLLRQEFAERPARGWVKPFALAATVACIAVAIALWRAPREASIDAEVIALVSQAGPRAASA